MAKGQDKVIKVSTKGGGQYLAYAQKKLTQLNYLYDLIGKPGVMDKVIRVPKKALIRLKVTDDIDYIRITGLENRLWILLVDDSWEHALIKFHWNKKEEKYIFRKTKKQLTTSPWWYLPEPGDNVKNDYQLNIVSDSTIYTIESHPRHNRHDVRLPALCYVPDIYRYGVYMFISWVCGFAYVGRLWTWIPGQNNAPAYAPYSANVDDEENIYPIIWVTHPCRVMNNFWATGRKHGLIDREGIKKLHIGIYYMGGEDYKLIYRTNPVDWTQDPIALKKGIKTITRDIIIGYGWDVPGGCTGTPLVDLDCITSYLQPPQWLHNKEVYDILPTLLATMGDKAIQVASKEDFKWESTVEPDAIDKTTDHIVTNYNYLRNDPAYMGGHYIEKVNQVTFDSTNTKTYNGATNKYTDIKENSIWVGDIFIATFKEEWVTEETAHAHPTSVIQTQEETRTKYEVPDPWAWFYMGITQEANEHTHNLEGAGWEQEGTAWYIPLPAKVYQLGNRYNKIMDYDYNREGDTFALIVEYDTLKGEYKKKWFSVLETFPYGFPKAWNRSASLGETDDRGFTRKWVLYYKFKNEAVKQIVFDAEAEGKTNELGVTFLHGGWEVTGVSLQVTDLNIVYTYTKMDEHSGNKKKYIGIINLAQKEVPVHYNQEIIIDETNPTEYFDHLSYRGNIAIALHKEGSGDLLTGNYGE